MLDHGSFVRFWAARLAAVFAYQMQAVAVGWQIYALTGSVFDLGLVGLAQFLPSVALLLVVGHVADRTTGAASSASASSSRAAQPCCSRC